MSASPASGLLEKLGVHVDPELLVLALTHRSFAHEHGGLPTNERLEFLGDTVLGVVVTEHLYRTYPDLPEGELARMRAATVSQKALARVARNYRFGSYVLLGRGELRTGGTDKDSILSDTVEAIIGAVYLSHGLEIARGLVHRLVGETLTAAANLGAGLDWKTSLQEVAASRGLSAPIYSSVHTGPDHARVFTSTVHVDGRLLGSGDGTAKKHAEQHAAEAAYEFLIAEAVEPDPAKADARQGAAEGA